MVTRVDYFLFHRHKIPAPQEGVDFIFLHCGEKKRRGLHILRPSEAHICAYCRNKGVDGDRPMEEDLVRFHLEQKYVFSLAPEFLTQLFLFLLGIKLPPQFLVRIGLFCL